MVKDKLALPFEVDYSEKPSKKSRTMKRLALVLKPENVDKIIAALKSAGLEATIYDIKSAGKERERVSSGVHQPQSCGHSRQCRRRRGSSGKAA